MWELDASFSRWYHHRQQTLYDAENVSTTRKEQSSFHTYFNTQDRIKSSAENSRLEFSRKIFLVQFQLLCKHTHCLLLLSILLYRCPLPLSTWTMLNGRKMTMILQSEMKISNWTDVNSHQFASRSFSSSSSGDFSDSRSESTIKMKNE